MAYETSYDAGFKPFNHDKNRGKWASSTDFLFACIGNAFRLDAIFVVPTMMFKDIGYFALIPYFIIMAICTIPIVFIQSFLGQFSSTGFISVFRISPLFKGIGYVSLAINITTLTYYSILSAIPFFYFLHSLRPTLPWSCEGAAEWYDYSDNFTTHCNLSKIEIDTDDFIVLESPSLDFFQSHLNIIPSRLHQDLGLTFSWSLMFCALVTWVLVWFVLRKPTETIGRILRYSHLAMFAILGLCFFRFIFLPHAFESLVGHMGNRFSRRHDQSMVSIPLVALSGLGPGWGSILTMASYNNFKTDITKYSWALCLGQFLLMFVGSLSLIMIESFMNGLHPSGVHMILNNNQWEQIISLPTALSLLEMPNFWSLLYFGVLFIGTTNLLIVQLFSVLTSLFDEYEKLRDRKDEVLYGSIGVLAIGSMLFCCNHGIKIFEFMSGYTVITQIFLNLMLLLVVLWVYGRERLQRDVHFMTNRTYLTCMVYIVRFIAPIFLLFSFLIGLIIALLETDYSVPILFIVTAVILLPWLLIPAYCIFKIKQTTGFVGMRLRRCVRPMDWYPADPSDRQRYEETFGNSDITHQLTTPGEEEEA